MALSIRTVSVRPIARSAAVRPARIVRPVIVRAEPVSAGGGLSSWGLDVFG